MKKVIILFLASFALSIIGTGSIFAQDWPMFRGDLQHTGYSTSTAPSTNDVLWAYHIGDRVWSSPAVAEGKVFIGSGEGKVYCFDASDGTEIWPEPYQTGGPIFSSPAVAEGKVFIGSWDGKVYCLDESDGSLIWWYDAGLDVHSCPAVADGKVFIGGLGYVYCFASP